MIFAAPWILLALAALPVLWWLLRVTPPAPRSERFPAIRLLAGLRAPEETPARTPLWLLVLRLLAAALLIVGLAGPVLDAGASLPGAGPLLLVIDDGWAAAADWPARVAAADAMLARAARDHRQAALLATADQADAAAPTISPVMPPGSLRARLAALRPKPWPVDRAAAAAALRRWRHHGTPVAYVADGVATAADPAFAAALRGAGPVTEIAPDPPQAAVLLPPLAEPDRLVARLAQLAQPMAGQRAVLAQSGDGRTLARAAFTLKPGARTAEAAIVLPPELRNRLTRLVLDGPASAAGVTLLDERWRRRPVGLMSPDATANVPLAGALYYLRRALGPYSELREGSVDTLLKRQIAVIILADEPLVPGPEQTALTRWVEHGGLLVRFAGPRMAAASAQATDPGVLPQSGAGDAAARDTGDAAGAADADGLLPVRLLAGDRQLGGALSWAKPARLAPFPSGSPFAGLPVPADVTVNRQVLAEPSTLLARRTWARLADGTPLVTAVRRGRGRVVLFHVTANADWSNLPLSGLFVAMLRRLVDLSVGIAPAPDTTLLAPAQTLDGFGTLGPPPQAATALPANAFAATPVSARHPPGLYGPATNRHALNLGAALPPLRAAAPIPGARMQPIAGIAQGARPRAVAAGGGPRADGARHAGRTRVARAAAASHGRRAACRGRDTRNTRARPTRRRRAWRRRHCARASPMSRPAIRRWTRSRGRGWSGCRSSSTSARRRRWPGRRR